jgi:hypothetical protein
MAGGPSAAALQPPAGADWGVSPLSFPVYQALMANFAAGMGAPVAQQQQPGSAMPLLSGSGAMDPSALLGGALAGDGGAAAMAQLLTFRSELFAVHLCVKLFHCTPSELPEDAREQLTGWLKSAPACTELYVRSGCVHLTLTVRLTFVPLHTVGLCICLSDSFFLAFSWAQRVLFISDGFLCVGRTDRIC